MAAAYFKGTMVDCLMPQTCSAINLMFWFSTLTPSRPNTLSSVSEGPLLVAFCIVYKLSLHQHATWSLGNALRGTAVYHRIAMGFDVSSTSPLKRAPNTGIVSTVCGSAQSSKSNSQFTINVVRGWGGNCNGPACKCCGCTGRGTVAVASLWHSGPPGGYDSAGPSGLPRPYTAPAHSHVPCPRAGCPR